MSAVQCISNALDVWKQAGVYDAPEMRPHIEKLEAVMRSKQYSEARKLIVAQQVHSKAIKNGIIKRVSMAISEEKSEALSNRLARVIEDDPTEGLRQLQDLLEFGIARGKRRRADGDMSLVGLQKATLSEINGKLHPIYERYFNRLGYGTKKDSDELRLVMEGGKSDSPQIVADAKYIRETLDEYRKQLKALGVYADDLPHWSPGRLAPGKIAKDVEGFKQFLREHLDAKHHPDVEDSIEYISASVFDPTPPQERVLSLSREVFLDTPEARVEYMKRFGDHDFVSALDGYARQLSQTIAEATLFGPDSARAFRRVAEDAAKRIAAKDPKMTPKVEKLIAQYQIVTNRYNDVYNPNAASAMGAGRNFASGIMLGAVALAQVSQDAVIAPFQMARRVGWGQAMADTFKAYGSMFDANTRRYLREELGIVEHVSHLMTPDARFVLDSPVTNVENFSRKFAIQSMRLTGTEFVEQMQRGVAGMQLSRALVRHLEMPWEDIPPSVRGLFENNAIGKRTWNQLQAMGPEIIDPDLQALRVGSIPDPRARMAVRALLVREAESMILRPDSTTQQFLMGGPRGTVGGEVTRFAAQFLSWPIQFARSVTARQVSLGVPGAMAAATGIYGMSIMTEQLYAVARGQPGYAWDNENLYYRALIRSGILTPIGELALGSAVGDWRASPSLGPVLDTVSQTFGRAGSIGQAVFEDDSYKATSHAVRGIKTLTPNIWWFEYMMRPHYDAIMWEVDPQFMRQYERRMMEERG